MFAMAKNETFEPTAYSRWIDDFLRDNDLTSYKLAPLCGVSQPTIDRIRSGESQHPARATIKKLERVILTPSPDSSGQVDENAAIYAGLSPQTSIVIDDIKRLASQKSLSDDDISLLHAIARRIAQDDTEPMPSVLPVTLRQQRKQRPPRNKRRNQA